MADFKAKVHKVQFPLGQLVDPLAVFKWPTTFWPRPAPAPRVNQLNELVVI